MNSIYALTPQEDKKKILVGYDEGSDWAIIKQLACIKMLDVSGKGCNYFAISK